MGYDIRAERVLVGAVAGFAPVLTVLRPVIQKAWSTNLDRQEVDLGDDANALGYLSYRNIGNLAVPLLNALEGVRASFATGSLEVRCAGRVLHLSKASSQSVSWVPRVMNWSGSDVRLNGAATNSEDYRGQEGTLFEAQPTEAEALTHLHLVWQGLGDGAVHTWVGFPRLGDPSWFALQDLGEAGPSAGLRPSSVSAAPAPMSSFDALEVPEPHVGLRREISSGSDEAARP